MDAHEVVIRKVERHGGFEIVELLGKGVGQPRESAHVHPYGQILALDVAGGNQTRVGVPGNDLAGDIDDLGWAIPTLRLYVRGSVGFYNLAVIRIAPKSALNRICVGRKGVGGDMHRWPSNRSAKSSTKQLAL